jgi:hypothetical protein
MHLTVRMLQPGAGLSLMKTKRADDVLRDTSFTFSQRHTRATAPGLLSLLYIILVEAIRFRAPIT